MKKFFYPLLAAALLSWGCEDKAPETPTLGNIYGIITSSTTSEPIQGAVVSIPPMGHSLTTGSDGGYLFSNLAAGDYTVQVTKTGYKTNNKKIKVLAGTVAQGDLSLAPGNGNGKIHGIITSKTTGEPIQSADVRVSPLGYTINTGADGGYLFSDIEPGDYTIQVSKTGYQTNTKQVKVLADATAQGDLSLALGNSSMSVDKSYLDFGTNADNNLATFNISNHGSNNLEWTISKTSDWITSITPITGTTKPNSSSSVMVQIDRSKLASTGQKYQTTLAITSDGGSAEVTVTVNGTSDIPSNGTVVTNGLLAYYTFDDNNAKDATDNELNGTTMGSPNYIEDTPSKKGKAIHLISTKNQYVNIPFPGNSPFYDFPSYSISLWIKDFGEGFIMGAISTGNGSLDYLYCVPRLINTGGKFLYQVTTGENANSTYNFESISLHDGAWHMLTLTSEHDKNHNDYCVTRFYIDGDFIDTYQAYAVRPVNSGKLQMGGAYASKGAPATSMKLDNVRLYSRTLSKEEVKQIYVAEQ